MAYKIIKIKRKIVKLFQRIIKYLDLQIQTMDTNLKYINQRNCEFDVRKQWDLETGKMFNDLVCRYPISEEELLDISEDICKYVMCTRLTNFRNILFVDGNYDKPRHFRKEIL